MKCEKKKKRYIVLKQGVGGGKEKKFTLSFYLLKMHSLQGISMLKYASKNADNPKTHNFPLWRVKSRTHSLKINI
jgi:hypothetical protein